jgi:transcriptional regulator with XRE-family HTH domain
MRQSLGMTQVTFARLLGVSLRTLSNAESSSTARRPDMLRRLKELERLVAALRELMAPGALRDWMITPSDAFEGSTPVQLIERGEADRIWQMVFALRTGQPM